MLFLAHCSHFPQGVAFSKKEKLLHVQFIVAVCFSEDFEYQLSQISESSNSKHFYLLEAFVLIKKQVVFHSPSSFLFSFIFNYIFVKI